MIYITRTRKSRSFIFIALYCLLTGSKVLFAFFKINESDPHFASLAQQEIEKMETGERGLACQQMIENIKLSIATTTVSPLTTDEKTWHPNDPKGTRSHVVAADTSIRGAKRDKPTSAIIYVNLNRIDPELSLFKLGTFTQLLAQAMELNMGAFSSDYRIRERQSMFFRNAWRESMGLSQYASSGNIATADYREAKKRGLIIEKNRLFFPIINPENFLVQTSTMTQEMP